MKLKLLGAFFPLLSLASVASAQVTITPLPTPPSRSDPSNFAARGDAFLGALPLFGTQLNTAANATIAAASSAINAPGTSAQSATSLSVATGGKSLTIQTGKAFVVGQFVQIASRSTPTAFMNGQITAHDSSSGALAVAVSYAQGAGSFTDWNVALSTPVDPSRFLPLTGGVVAGNLRLAAADIAERHFEFGYTNSSRTLYLYANTNGTGYYDTIGGEIWSYSLLTGLVTIRGSQALTAGNLASSNVTTALGYTPANRAGDTFTGPIAVGGSIAREANFYLDMSGSNPVIVVKNGSYARYDRTADHWVFVINNSAVLSVNGAGDMTIRGTLIQNGTPN